MQIEIDAEINLERVTRISAEMLDGTMVDHKDHKMFVYNAARDNNLAALKVSVLPVLYILFNWIDDSVGVMNGSCDWNSVLEKLIKFAS